jgi:hypothetical protein
MTYIFKFNPISQQYAKHKNILSISRFSCFILYNYFLFFYFSSIIDVAQRVRKRGPLCGQPTGWTKDGRKLSDLRHGLVHHPRLTMWLFGQALGMLLFCPDTGLLPGLSGATCGQLPLRTGAPFQPGDGGSP